MRTPKVLVVSTSLWPMAGRICIALSKAGFCVGAISRTDSVVRVLNAITTHFDYKQLAKRRSILNAIKAFNPDILVCADDQAVSDLHRIHSDASKKNNAQSRALVKLIELTLGNSNLFAVTTKKSEFVAFAESLGIRCPKTKIIPDKLALNRELKKITYPVVLKADGTCGGAGVQIASNRQDAQRAFRRLVRPRGLDALVKSIDELSLQPLLNWVSRQRQVVTLQQYISGRPANRAVVCANERILAGLSVVVHETSDSTGPATVAEVVDHADMRDTTERLVGRLGLRGFHGFDFIIDSSNNAWLLELNSRVTSTSHLSFGNFDPAAAFFSYVTGSEIRSSPSPVMDKLIALFPQEIRRCPGSEYLQSGYHDVPWEEPEFVRACLTPAIDVSIAGRLRKRISAVFGLGNSSARRGSEIHKSFSDLVGGTTIQSDDANLRLKPIKHAGGADSSMRA